MSDSVTVTSIKDALAQCPVCTEYFNDTSYIPRRMPCCDQSICELCLETCTGGRTSLSCPLCRHKHNLPGGIKSLPKEMLILRFLDVLKTQSNAVPSCTDCPDNNTAMARCDTCSIYLCQPCLAAHCRNRTTRNHKTSTFEKIATLRLQRSKTSAKQVRSQDIFGLNGKMHSTNKRIQELAALDGNILKSKKLALQQINQCFDSLIEVLQQRRAVLLSVVESKTDRELYSITKSLGAHKSLQLKLQQAQTGQHSSASMDVLLNESPEDAGYVRIGISFIQVNIHQLTDLIKSAGQVRSVAYTPVQKPAFIPETDVYNVITQTPPDDFPQGTDLEWDSNIANDNITISGSVITNTKTKLPPPDTGCRIQARGHVLTTRPLVIGRGQRVMYHVKVRFSIRQVIAEKRMVFESALTSSPLDSTWSQPTGLSVRISSCATHTQQLCLRVRYHGKLLTDVSIIKNKVGESRDLHLCFLLDGNTNMIHIVDVDDIRVICSVADAVFEAPLWVLMYVDIPIRTNMSGELLSGHKGAVSQEMAELISSLH